MNHPRAIETLDERLTVAAWALGHGSSVRRAHGSLARHDPDGSVDGVVDVARALID